MKTVKTVDLGGFEAEIAEYSYEYSDDVDYKYLLDSYIRKLVKDAIDEDTLKKYLTNTMCLQLMP